MLRMKAVILFLAERLLRLLWIFPLKPKQVLFLSYGGKQFSDSPKALYECYLRHQSPCRLLWAADSRETEQSMRAQGLETVRAGTLRFLLAFTQSGKVITNCHVATYLPVRKQQIVINTWHGSGPLKTNGFDDPHTTPYDRLFFDIQNRKYSAFLSGCAFNTDVICRHSFDYHGTVLEFGLPRNAVLFTDGQKAREEVLKQYGVSAKDDPFVLLYAPTYRGDLGSGEWLSDADRLDAAWLKRTAEVAFHRPCVCLFRGHHAMAKNASDSGFIDVSAHGDMQALLQCANALITDYSSCMTDMALTKKPVFLYTPDQSTYLRERGMYWPPERLPFPLCQTKASLADAMAHFDCAAYEQALNRYFEQIGLAEGADSDERVYAYLEGNGPFPMDTVIGRTRRAAV
ncbi:MAG: CDP-glycerol glycerophosphotransferase family protein [Clostridia bacterium]|nr:CDP-glycerol glycerophosphotransferase family protein [Clostridia bacterium]